MAKFPCWPGCNCGGCIGECYMLNGCPDGAPCRPCYDQWDYEAEGSSDGQSLTTVAVPAPRPDAETIGPDSP